MKGGVPNLGKAGGVDHKSGGRLTSGQMMYRRGVEEVMRQLKPRWTYKCCVQT